MITFVFYSPMSRVRGGVVFISVVRALVLVLYGSVFLNSSLRKPRYEVSFDVVQSQQGGLAAPCAARGLALACALYGRSE